MRRPWLSNLRCHDVAERRVCRARYTLRQRCVRRKRDGGQDDDRAALCVDVAARQRVFFVLVLVRLVCHDVCCIDDRSV